MPFPTSQYLLEKQFGKLPRHLAFCRSLTSFSVMLPVAMCEMSVVASQKDRQGWELRYSRCHRQTFSALSCPPRAFAQVHISQTGREELNKAFLGQQPQYAAQVRSTLWRFSGGRHWVNVRGVAPLSQDCRVALLCLEVWVWVGGWVWVWVIPFCKVPYALPFPPHTQSDHTGADEPQRGREAREETVCYHTYAFAVLRLRSTGSTLRLGANPR